MRNQIKWRVSSFGRDCLGNVSGYRVVRGFGWDTELDSQFVADLYEPGSHAIAKVNASRRCAALNA